MTNPNSLLHHLRDLAGLPPGGDVGDGELLDRFVAARDEGAFAALVHRHGGMVWHVCRRSLGNEHDADDVFQATFLLLARKAASIRKQTAVASWLHGVAARLSVRLRQQDGRRQRRERRVNATPASEPSVEAAWRDLRTLLDEELARLSDKYRTPLVLCYFEGKTHEQAAAELGWPLGTVRGRVARARDLLRLRLTRRGLVLSATAFATALTVLPATASAPVRLVAPTVQAALQYAGGSVAAGLVRAEVLALAEGGLDALLATKVKVAAAALAMLGMLAVGVGLLLPRTPAEKDADPPEANAPPAPPPQQTVRAARPAGRDRLGDPLPGDAVGRLGDDRFRLISDYYTARFSPDGKTLAVAQIDNTIQLLEMPDGRELGRLGTPAVTPPGARAHYVSQMTFATDGKTLAVLKPQRGVVLWDVPNRREIGVVAVDLQYEVAGVALSPDGRTLVTGGKQQPVRLWDVASAKELRRLVPNEEHPAAVAAVSLSPDGKIVATGGDEQSVRLWEADTGKEMLRLAGHRRAIRAIAFAPDGRSVASAADDGSVRVWETATGKPLHLLDARAGFDNPKAPTGIIAWLSFTADGGTLALGRSDRSVRFWEVASGKELTRFEGQPGPATNVAMSPDGRLVVMGNVHGTGGRIHAWDRVTGQELGTAEGHRYAVLALAWSADGRMLVSGGADRTVRVWDAATERQLRVLHGHGGGVTSVAIAPDGKRVASACRDENDPTVSLWDAETGAELRQLRLKPLGEAVAPALRARDGGPEPLPVSVAFAPDRRSLATLDTWGLLWLWETASGRPLRHVASRCRGFAFAPDGGGLFADDGDGLKEFDAATGKERRRFEGAAGPIECLSPDGTTLLTRDAATLQFWDTKTGRLRREVVDPGLTSVPSLPGRPVICFAPDGRTLAVRGKGGLRLLEAASGRERLRLTGHHGEVTAAAFAPGGRAAATASEDATVLLWPLFIPRGGEGGLPALWAALERPDAAAAYTAMQTLASRRRDTIPFLKGHLRAAPTPEAAQVRKWIAELDGEEFTVRQAAMEALEKLGEPARSLLTEARENQPSAEARRRLDAILTTLHRSAPQGETLRAVRAVELLERIGTREARSVLEELGKGAPEATLTREARAALKRFHTD